MRLSQVAFSNLRRRVPRSILTILGVGAAVAVVTSLVGVAESLESSFLALYNRRGTDLVVQRRGGTVQLSKGLPTALGERIRALPEAGQVIGGLMDMVTFEQAGLFMVIVNGWDADCPVLDRVKIVTGRRLQAGDERKTMLGKVLAAQLDKHPGDTIELYSQHFEVVGIFESFSIYENGAAFLLMNELQRQMDRPGQLTGYVVQAQPPGDPAAIRRLQSKIEALDPNVAATPCAQFVHSLNQMQVARTMAGVVSGIAGVLGALGMLNNMAMSVFERRREFGVLRALGWRRWRIVWMVILESLWLAAGGAAIGLAVGLAVPRALTYWPPTAVLIQGDLSWTGISAGAGLALAMAVLGSSYPAYRCTRVSPISALRGS
jgi:putative ABC transport system permease protein